MAKLALVPNPTFTAPVEIHIPGNAKPAVTKFTFKHLAEDDYNAFITSLKDRTQTDALLDILVGWEVDAEFTPENLEAFVKGYLAAAAAIIGAYFDQMTGKARRGN